MAEAINGLAEFIGSKLAECTNAVSMNLMALQGVSFIVESPSVLTKLSEISASLLGINNVMNGTLVPAVASGTVAPYSVSSNLSKAVSNINDMAESGRMSSQSITKEELTKIIEDAFRRYGNIEFYIGDEKLAKHANNGNALLSRRYNS